MARGKVQPQEYLLLLQRTQVCFPVGMPSGSKLPVTSLQDDAIFWSPQTLHSQYILKCRCTPPAPVHNQKRTKINLEQILRARR